MGQAVLLVVAMLVFQFGLGVPVGIVAAIFNSGVNPKEVLLNPWVLAPLNIVAISATIAIGLRIGRRRAADFYAIRPFAWRLVGPVLLTAVGGGVLIDQFAKYFLEAMQFLGVWHPSEWDQYLLTKHPLGAVLLVVIVAPFMEEYLLRGMILRGLLTRHRPVVAVVFTSLLFGLMHANVLQFFVGGAIGLMFGWWYFRTRSVGPGILGHAVFNSIALLAVHFPKLLSPLGIRGEEDIVDQPIWLTLAGAVAIALGILWFEAVVDSLPAPEPEQVELPVESLLPFAMVPVDTGLPPVLGAPMEIEVQHPDAAVVPPILPAEEPPVL